MLDAFERCVERGGVAVFPADTVYGLACDPENPAAVQRLYALKGRAPDKPAAVMFFSLDAAQAALPELGPRTRGLLGRLLPGGVTLLVPNPAGRFPLAGGGDRLGVRVPAGGPLAGARVAVLQSSANDAGAPAATRLEEVPHAIRSDADLVLGVGPLPGTPSTVVDVARFEAEGRWAVVRAGAVPEAAIAAAVAAV